MPSPTSKYPRKSNFHWDWGFEVQTPSFYVYPGEVQPQFYASPSHSWVPYHFLVYALQFRGKGAREWSPVGLGMETRGFPLRSHELFPDAYCMSYTCPTPDRRFHAVRLPPRHTYSGVAGAGMQRDIAHVSNPTWILLSLLGENIWSLSN